MQILCIRFFFDIFVNLCMTLDMIYTFYDLETYKFLQLYPHHASKEHLCNDYHKYKIFLHSIKNFSNKVEYISKRKTTYLSKYYSNIKT